MSSEEDKTRGLGEEHHSHHGHHYHHEEEPQQYPIPAEYGTFQGVPSYPPPRPPQPHPHPTMGFPQPIPPPGAIDPTDRSQYYAHGICNSRRKTCKRAPAPLLWYGSWLVPIILFGRFIIGFFLGAIPWYVGAIILACGRFDHREKPGYVTCTIAAILVTMAVIIGATKASDVW